LFIDLVQIVCYENVANVISEKYQDISNRLHIKTAHGLEKCMKQLKSFKVLHDCVKITFEKACSRRIDKGKGHCRLSAMVLFVWP